MRVQTMLLLVVSILLVACGRSDAPVLADILLPAGFPSEAPVPDGSATLGYTGSVDTGFTLRVTTSMGQDPLIGFVTDAVAASGSWSLSPAEAGLPVLPGYDADWVIFTRDGQVVTGPSGTYEGGVGVAGSNLNILLTPTVQPRDGIEPPVLPARADLPRPTSTLDKTAYTSGKINLTYQGGEGVFDTLIDAYRAAGWAEADVTGYGDDGPERSALGDLGKWRVSIRDFFGLSGGPIILEVEDLTLSFP